MRNIIIATSIVFIAVIVASYLYFSNLSQDRLVVRDETEKTEADQPLGDDASIQQTPLWSFDLNAPLLNTPIVLAKDSVEQFILVQDAYYILYAIAVSGEQLWNAQLPGPILGSILQLADLTLVFTTAERLYRVDTGGDPLPGFSLRLPQRATERGATVSHESTKNLRIDVAAGSRLLSFDGRGRLLQTRKAVENKAIDKNQAIQADTSFSLPQGCGPFTYYGQLSGAGNYLLCGKSDRKLYCYRYD